MSENSEKCNKVAANTDGIPQWTMFAAAGSTWPSISSATEDSNATREDIPAGLPSTRSHPRWQRSASPPTWRCFPMLRLVHLKSPDSLLQTVGESDLVGRWPEDHITDPHARVLKEQAPLHLLLELSKHLLRNIHPEGFSARVPEHGLCGGRHRRPEHGNLPSHLSMIDGGNLHPLRLVAPHARGGGVTMAWHNLDPLVCRRVSSRTKSWHYCLAPSRLEPSICRAWIRMPGCLLGSRALMWRVPRMVLRVAFASFGFIWPLSLPMWGLMWMR
jgi:hypothetical protein